MKKKEKMKDWYYQTEKDYPEDYYGHSFLCNNCGYKNYIWVKKGIKIPKELPCENCDVLTKTK